jgi:hypothetical protein
MSNKIVKTGRKGGQLGNKNSQKWTERKALKLGRGILAWFEEDKTRIWFEDYFREQGMYRELLNYLARTFPSFFSLVDECKQIQESRLVALGLSKTNSTAMTMFVLKNCHGWTDQQNITHTQNVPVLTYKVVGLSKELEEPYYGDNSIEDAEFVE